ncbi:MAG: diguanylate cyclase/phosphodiesterase (GGDEF & EAL domains) with PAS/PAC sensor(s), partial [uncultured Rubrobacteraceae bacterium]
AGAYSRRRRGLPHDPAPGRGEVGTRVHRGLRRSGGLGDLPGEPQRRRGYKRLDDAGARRARLLREGAQLHRQARRLPLLHLPHGPRRQGAPPRRHERRRRRLPIEAPRPRGARGATDGRWPRNVLAPPAQQPEEGAGEAELGTLQAGPSRPADEARQQAPAAGGPRDHARPGRALRPQLLGYPLRHRLLQALQRHIRASNWRRRAPEGGGGSDADFARRRHLLPLRRRGVSRHPPRANRRIGHGRRRAPEKRGGGARDTARSLAVRRRHGELRPLGPRLRRPEEDDGRALEGGGHRPLQGQGKGQEQRRGTQRSGSAV